MTPVGQDRPSTAGGGTGTRAGQRCGHVGGDDECFQRALAIVSGHTAHGDAQFGFL